MDEAAKDKEVGVLEKAEDRVRSGREWRQGPSVEVGDGCQELVRHGYIVQLDKPFRDGQTEPRKPHRQIPPVGDHIRLVETGT